MMQTSPGARIELTYEIDVAGAKGRLNVTVELLYQTLSYPFVSDLANTNTDLVNDFMSLYNPADNVPVVLARAQIR